MSFPWKLPTLRAAVHKGLVSGGMPTGAVVEHFFLGADFFLGWALIEAEEKVQVRYVGEQREPPHERC
jgi:hypothetical protein